MEKTDHPIEGRPGPTKPGELQKQSDHVKEWRSRYFILAERRLYYYENQDEAPTELTAAGSQGQHKGWIDMTGAAIEPFEDDDADGHWYGIQVTEEWTLRDDGSETTPQKWRLLSSIEEQIQDWQGCLMFASRPRWIDDDDPRGLFCMESAEKFSLTKRKQYCRRCGGVFLKGHTTIASFPALGYEKPVTACRPCAEGKKKASRYINKVPKSKRSNRAPKLHDAAADAIVGGASRSFNKFKKGFSKATKQIADATGIESLAVEVKLQLNKEGWMTKLGEVRKSWKRRWFKLDGEVNKVMWYYEDEGCTKEKGQIDLRQVSSVRIAPQDPQRIELVTPDRRASSIDGLLPQRLTRRSFPGLTCWPVAGFVQS